MIKFFLFLLLLFVSNSALAEETTKPVTSLDQAFILASQNSKERDKYYNIFLNSEIYIPTYNIPAKEGSKRAEDNQTFNPIVVQNNNTSYILLFDTLERLNSWVKNQQQVGYVKVSGHAIVEMMDATIPWAMNVNTPYMKIFVSEEIKQLKKDLIKSKAHKIEITKGTKVLVSAPTNIPQGLVESITKSLLRNKEVKEAYFGEVDYKIKGEKPHLLLVLRTDPVSSSVMDNIVNDISVSSRSYFKEQYFDIAIDDGKNDFVSDVIKIVKPFYVRKSK